jgi:F0F1-type ATP synthase delta subunit
MNDVEQLYKELFSEIHSVVESWDLIHQIDAVIEALFDNKVPFEEKLDKHLEYGIKNNILMLVQKSKIPTDNVNAMQNFFEDLKNRIKTLPVIHLQVAIEPNTTMVKHIAEWLYFNLKKNILIDVQVRPNIVGGTIIGYDGKMDDYTLRRRIKEKYLIHRAMQNDSQPAVTAPAQPEAVQQTQA